jgi:hypothetical protein
MNEFSLKRICTICKLTKDEVLALTNDQIQTLIQRDSRLKELFGTSKTLTVDPPVSVVLQDVKLVEPTPTVTLTSTVTKPKRPYNRKVKA